MKRRKPNKNTTFIILIIAIFILVFSTYIYSLIKGDTNPHNEKELADERVIEKPEEDKDYNSYCNINIEYTPLSPPKRKGNILTQDVSITLTNNSEQEYTSWQFKIPSSKISIDKLEQVSYTVQNNHVFIKNQNQVMSIKPNSSINIDATLAFKSGELHKLLKVLVITSCSTEKSTLVEKGNAKLSLGPLDQELTPEISIENINKKQVTYAIYLNNNSNYNVYNYRFQISYEQGDYVSLNNAKVDHNYNARIINATNSDVINSNSKSIKFTLVLNNVSSDYIPDIVSIGQIKE